MPSVGPPQPQRAAVAPDPRGALIDYIGNPAASPQTAQALVMGENWKREDADISAKAQDRRDLLQMNADRYARDAANDKLAIEVRQEAARNHDEMMRQIAAMKSDNSSLPKPKVGFRYTEDGTQEVIPGGPEDIKQKAQAEKERTAHETATRLLNAEIANIDKLIGSEDKKIPPHPGLAAMTGSIDVRFPTVLQDTADAEALLESLQSKASINALRDVRSGGSQSIGQITEREWPRLESMKATLQAKQGDKQFPKSLKEYRDELLQTKKDLDAALNEVSLGVQPSETSSGIPAGVDPKLWEHMTPEEKALFTQ